MSINLYGRRVELPNSACWTDGADVVKAVTRGKGTRVKYVTDGRKRKAPAWPSGLVVHTTSGHARKVQPGLLESVRDWVYARYQTNTDREVSWHATLDLDGSVIQQAGPEWMCWHAGQVNASADGWELVEGSGGVLTEVQLARFVELVDLWTWHTGIPRVIPWRDGKPFAGMLTRALSAHGAGKSLACVYGHRSVWGLSKKTGKLYPVRGAGDPSDLPFLALAEAGYQRMDVESGEDLALFKRLQAELGVEQDGVWGRASRLAHWRAVGADYVFTRRPRDEGEGVPAFVTAA